MSRGNSLANSMSNGNGPGSPYWRQSYPPCLLAPATHWTLTIGQDPA